MISQDRYQAEDAILAHYIPRTSFRFENIYSNHPVLKITYVTRNRASYVLYFDLVGFPKNKPKVYVMKMMYDKNGHPMDSISATNHTLQSWNGWTQLCHYSDEHWRPNITLMHVYIKCAAWLEIYQAHLRTGYNIGAILAHQQSHVPYNGA